MGRRGEQRVGALYYALAVLHYRHLNPPVFCNAEVMGDKQRNHNVALEFP